MPPRKTLETHKKAAGPVRSHRASPAGKTGGNARNGAGGTKPAPSAGKTAGNGKTASYARKGTAGQPRPNPIRMTDGAGKRLPVRGARRPAAQPAKPGAAGKSGRSESVWWGLICAGLICALMLMGYYVSLRLQEYGEFRRMRSAVERAGFYDGIVIDGINVSGLSLEEGIAKLEARDRSRRESMQVTLTCEGKSWTLTAEEMDYGSNYISVARHAYQVGRGGTLEERYAAIDETGSENISYSVTYGYDKTLLRAGLDLICEELTVAAQPARVSGFDAESRSFSFAGGQSGYAVDGNALYRQVAAAVDGGEAATIVIHREKVSAGVSAQTLMERYGEISTAVTNASSSSSNRLTNIRLALSLIDGVRIDPGETFSFNDTVGQRTTARGFKLAGAYVNGETTEDVGGGICQVSTTLFNAAVKADMTIVERSPHSKPVSYVDRGKDAAVDWPGTDLKIRNDSDEPVYIVAGLSSDKRVKISIFGRKLENGEYILVEAETTNTIRPGADRVILTDALEPGETRVVTEARTGYKAVAYKVRYSASGAVISREILCRSSYAAAAAVIEKGK